jgi:hypothetical protein
VIVVNLPIFIRSDEAAPQIQGVSLHTCSTATELSPDAEAATVVLSRRRIRVAGQRPRATKEIPS